MVPQVYYFNYHLCFLVPLPSFSNHLHILCRAERHVHFISGVECGEVYLELVLISSIEKYLLKPVAPQDLLW